MTNKEQRAFKAVIEERLKNIDYINGGQSDELLLTSFNRGQLEAFNRLIQIAKEYNTSVDYILGITEEYYGNV